MQTGVTQSGVLAYIPSPPQGVWHLAGIPIRAYALCIIIGIIVAVIWGNRRWIARGGRDGEVLDVAIWAVPFGLIGGRLYHLATDWNTYFGDGGKEPIDALKVWDGGLGIWGAVLLGAVGAWIGTRRAGISLPAFGDAIGPPILLAQAIGRLGNYFNQELFGADTTMPWGLKIYERTPVLDPDSPWTNINGHSTGVVVRVVQPTFLYELVWNVLIVIALVIIDRRFRVGHGRLFAMYVAGYCAGRFVIEALRHDYATHIFGLRINLFTAALVFIGAVIYILLAPRGRETPIEVYRPGRAPAEYYEVDGYGEEDAPEADAAADDTDFEAIADDYADELDRSEKPSEQPAADETDTDEPEAAAAAEDEEDEEQDTEASGEDTPESPDDSETEPSADEKAEASEAKKASD
jgi:prolipoprotein diacylglyceryl transferase